MKYHSHNEIETKDIDVYTSLCKKLLMYDTAYDTVASIYQSRTDRQGQKNICDKKRKSHKM
jgi:hypothetical protein